MAIEIWTAEDLYNVRNDLGASYIQMADIDLSSYSNWAPIGSPTGCFSDGSFSGTYDGNNFKITNLTINDPTGTKESNGLFSPLTGILKNIILEDVNVVGAKNIGALAGRANCVSFGATTLIENCHVISGSVSGNKNVGGLIGNSSLWYGEGLGNNHIKVLKCSVNCSIRGGKSIGGIIGKCSGAEDTAPGSLPSNVQIILCSSNVSITMFQLDLSEYYGSNTPNIGGIVGGFTYWRDNLGSIFGLIQDCFSFCSVDVSSEVTFLDGCGFNIGSILGGAGNRIKIENCYGVPNFNINYSLDPNDGSTINTVGGLFGGHTSLDAPIIISSSYYNSEEYAPNIDNGYGTAKTTTELKEEALFEDWISSGRWLMEPEINDGYPYFASDGPIITVIETLVDFAFPYYYFPVDYSLYEEEPPAPPIEGKNVYSSLIPIYRTASKISQPIIIEGNIGAVRAGKLIAQTIIIPEQTNPGLIRIKNKKGEYTYSLTAPEISGKDAVLTKEVIASVDGVLYVESKYSKIKYAKGLYGMYTKNPPQ